MLQLYVHHLFQYSAILLFPDTKPLVDVVIVQDIKSGLKSMPAVEMEG